MNATLTVLALLSAAEPEFVLHSTRDDRPIGVLVRLDADGTAQVAGSAAVPGVDVVALRRRDLPPTRFPHDRPYTLFANGDRIPGSVVDIAGDVVRLLADLGAERELRVPLSTLTAAFLTGRAATRASEPAGRRWLAGTRKHDVVWLANGDTLAGTVSAFSDGGPLRLDSADVARERIDAVVFNSELARPRKVRGPYRQLVLRNGARLSVRSAALRAGELDLITVFGTTLCVPLENVVAIDTRQGRAVYLSDSSPKRYEHTPYLGTRWTLGVDRSTAGSDLRLGGGTYDKGIGLHSKSRATFAVPSGTLRFEALVGLDEKAGRAGAVRITIDADGKPIVPPFDISAADPPKELLVPMPTGAKEFTIDVDFGRGGDVQDHVDWADARFVVRS